MNIHTAANYDQLSKEAAQYTFDCIKKGLEKNHKFIPGLATGSSPRGLYKELIRLLGESKLDLSQLYTFNLDEYFPVQQDEPNSYYQEMLTLFWEPLHKANPTFDPGHGHLPNGEALEVEEECIRYENHLDDLGGIDLQILGIGRNGHIGFNEPGSLSSSRTRLVSIAEETRRVNAEKFFEGDIDMVPRQAITMGISTIMKARDIVLLISGESKTDIFKKLIDIKTPTADIPASYLQTHPHVEVFSDIKMVE